MKFISKTKISPLGAAAEGWKLLSHKRHRYSCLCLIYGFVLQPILAYAPLFVPGGISKSTLADSVVQDNVLEPNYSVAVLISVVICIPMIVDLVLDGRAALKLPTNEKFHWFSRLLFLLTLAVPNGAYYAYWSSGGTELNSQIHFSNRAFMTTASVACVVSLASQIRDQSIHPGPMSLVVMTCYLLSGTLNVFSYIPNRSKGQLFGTLSYVFGIAGFVFVIYFAVRFGGKVATRRSATSFGICVIMYFVSVIVLILARVVLNVVFSRDPFNAPTLLLCWEEYLQLIFTVAVMTLPGHYARVNATRAVRTVDEKKAFIRYISQQVLGPLKLAGTAVSRLRDDIVLVIPSIPAQAESILDSVGEVQSSVQVALSIINDLTTFDKLDGGAVLLETQETNPSTFVTQTIVGNQLLATRFGVHLKLDFANNAGGARWDEKLFALIDPYKMEQALTNLIRNAIKSSPRGSDVMIRVFTVAAQREDDNPQRYQSMDTRSTLAPQMGGAILPPPSQRSRVQSQSQAGGNGSVVQPSGGGGAKFSSMKKMKPINPTFIGGRLSEQMIRIEVVDFGPGYTKEAQKALFRRGDFTTMGENGGEGETDGSKLMGLWTSKGIVELHGGRIGVDSEPGKGSAFYIDLPLYQQQRKKAVSFSDDRNSNDRRSERNSSHATNHIAAAFNTATGAAPAVAASDRNQRSGAGGGGGGSGTDRTSQHSQGDDPDWLGRVKDRASATIKTAFGAADGSTQVTGDHQKHHRSSVSSQHGPLRQREESEDKKGGAGASTVVREGTIRSRILQGPRPQRESITSLSKLDTDLKGGDGGRGGPVSPDHDEKLATDHTEEDEHDCVADPKKTELRAVIEANVIKEESSNDARSGEMRSRNNSRGGHRGAISTHSNGGGGGVDDTPGGSVHHPLTTTRSSGDAGLVLHDRQETDAEQLHNNKEPTQFMIIDDDEKFAKDVDVIVNNMGYTSIHAKESSNAVQVLENCARKGEHVDVIIVGDLKSSQPSGFDIVHIIRQRGFTGTIAGITNAGHDGTLSTMQRLERFKQMGADESFVKPVGERELLQLL